MSLSEVKDRVFSKYFVDKNNIGGGFWFFFGLGRNPYEDAVQKIHEKNVRDALKEDWMAISGDMSKVFARESEKIDGRK